MMVKTRFAPSPTGYLHIGGARTALFSHLYALHNKGTTVLRIEDTDLERSTPEAVAAIIESLEWLGLHYDEGPYYQTKRFDRYKEVIAELLESGHAYYCYCTQEELAEMRAKAEAKKEKPRYDGTWRPEPGKTLPAIPEGIQPVVRFKQPQVGATTFVDLVHGNLSVQNSELDDLIIARGDGSPTYNFCVVVDDVDMEITHVIRGDDHINNTYRQVNIFKAMNKPVPKFAHLAMILGDDGQKLSKRHGAVGVMEYYHQGYLPEAVLNYLVRLGWSHGDQEIFSFEEMVQYFDLNNVNKSASAFNTSKLRWLNQHYMIEKNPTELAMLLKPFLEKLGVQTETSPEFDNYLTQVVEAHVKRCETLVELAEMVLYLFTDTIEMDEAAKAKQLIPVSKPVLEKLVEILGNVAEWTPANLDAAVKEVTQVLEVGMGKVGMPLRTAIVGRTNSPNLDETLFLVGKERTLDRLGKAIAMIEG
ncbi:glutamate--tRNA ligase [Ignatzschineria ureiclastica]|uniref:Glutamate--tRNA ligase n=1 Tax=Ignatzschineria ureiclastica TaxID=472582 RepID=A0A2U2ACH8_9GAMM|nr:glutamate--tRNA ligase [Ignatzschineria ureiclastica]PWD80370.1 glutamate--tRNA ligase [Ignatzschineria ureiclastica]GHA00026.1 glutamate--tRNA ligase [Ignatzschineria ureiclastica]